MTDPECIAAAADSRAVSHSYASPDAESALLDTHAFIFTYKHSNQQQQLISR